MSHWLPTPDPGSTPQSAFRRDRGAVISTDFENIIELLGPQEVIGRAIAVLIAEREVSRDAAFEILVQDSAAAHETVRETAASIVSSSTHNMDLGLVVSAESRGSLSPPLLLAEQRQRPS